MKIAIMLRAIEEIDGPGIAATNLVDALIDLDRDNEYVVLYMKEEFIGRYSQYSHVKELVLKTSRKLIYDQVLVPWACRKEKVDLIFSPKFSVPLLSGRDSIVIQRGSEYWIYPQFYDRLDLLYVNTFLPLYCRKAKIVLTLSDVLKHDLHRYISVPMEKMHTVYSAPHERFKMIDDRDYLDSVRVRIGLPREPFILAVTKPYAAVGSSKKEFYPGKNTEAVVASFRKCKEQLGTDIKLVLLGKDVRETWVQNYGEGSLADGDIEFPGYISQELMPAIYNMAALLSFPSYYESFGIPIVEAMACGCPVVTADVGACPEIIGDAGYAFAPDDIDGPAAAMVEILTNKQTAADLTERGLSRVKSFSWLESAKTLRSLFHQCKTA